MARPNPQAVLEHLKTAIQLRATVVIVYHGGSQPGAKRSIIPLEILGHHVRAHDVARKEDRTFTIAKIELPAQEVEAPVYDPSLTSPDASAGSHTVVEVNLLGGTSITRPARPDEIKEATEARWARHRENLEDIRKAQEEFDRKPGPRITLELPPGDYIVSVRSRGSRVWQIYSDGKIVGPSSKLKRVAVWDALSELTLAAEVKEGLQ